jgi:predicted nucleic acid-binding protein
MRFVDTNVLLYSVSTHPDEARKAVVAAAVVDAGDLCLSVQVLQESYVQATRATRPGALSHDDAVAFVGKWLRFPVQDTTVVLVQNAFAAKARWNLSYWDAAVVEAARLLGCREVLSEDMAHGQDYGGVRIVDPFA